jgi:hypothetical protein
MLIKASRFINEKDPHSTVVLLLLQPGKASWAHCGDSSDLPFSWRQPALSQYRSFLRRAIGGAGQNHA